MKTIKQLADEIWEYAETGFEEYKSCKAMCEFLRQEGFEVEEGIADMETAYRATYGSGAPVICFLTEYDALFGMNQVADKTEYQPITTNEDTGHGCGHHLLGTGAIAGAMKFKEYLEKNKVSGTCVVLGCPAEESGSGKAYLARDGYLDNVDIALTWHPSNYNQVVTGSSQSCIAMFFKFHGVSSHAAGSPHLGRSALDACELMNVGVNYLREHMESSDSAKKGKVLLATVKGDVHDIGKNLVEIILANNGYEIINLGINVRSDRIVQEVQEKNFKNKI